MSQSKLTLEQLRAKDVWARCDHVTKEYAILAKGLPALIMNSGLLQVLAFLHEKGSKHAQRHCQELGDDLRDWLHQRFKSRLPTTEFKSFMTTLMQADPRTYQDVHAEALAWLRWMRQMAPAALAARNGKEER
jgi:CRISPR-associated protein Cmr5